MGTLAVLALFYFRFSRTEMDALRENTGPYGIVWEEQELSELLYFIQRALKEMDRRGGCRLLPPDAFPEQVRITRDLRVFIGSRELKLRPMAKSVLLLFLRHPEGIALKDIADHREELLSYYRRVMRSLNPSVADSRIQRILNIFNNDLNVNIARINAAVSLLVAEDKRPYYQIGGRAGRAKSIPIDRSRVLWEQDASTER